MIKGNLHIWQMLWYCKHYICVIQSSKMGPRWIWLDVADLGSEMHQPQKESNCQQIGSTHAILITSKCQLSIRWKELAARTTSES